MVKKSSIAVEVKKNEYKESIDGIADKVIKLMNKYDEHTAIQMFKDDIMNIISNLQKAVKNESIKRGDVDKAINQIGEKIGEEISKKIKESEDESNKSKHSNAIIRLIENIIRKIMNYRASKADTKHNKDLYTSFAKEEITKVYFAPNSKDKYTEKQMLFDFKTSLKILSQNKRLATREELKAIDDELPSIKVQKLTKTLEYVKKESDTNLKKLTKELKCVKKKLAELTAENAKLLKESVTVNDGVTDGSQDTANSVVQGRGELLEKSVTVNDGVTDGSDTANSVVQGRDELLEEDMMMKNDSNGSDHISNNVKDYNNPLLISIVKEDVPKKVDKSHIPNVNSSLNGASKNGDLSDKQTDSVSISITAPFVNPEHLNHDTVVGQNPSKNIFGSTISSIVRILQKSSH